jgi:hypothetical protein
VRSVSWLVGATEPLRGEVMWALLVERALAINHLESSWCAIASPGVEPAHQRVRAVSIVLPPDQTSKEATREEIKGARTPPFDIAGART